MRCQLAAQAADRHVLVLALAPALGGLGLDAGGGVDDVDGRLHLVAVLAAGAADAAGDHLAVLQEDLLVDGGRVRRIHHFEGGVNEGRSVGHRGIL